MNNDSNWKQLGAWRSGDSGLAKCKYFIPQRLGDWWGWTPLCLFSARGQQCFAFPQNIVSIAGSLLTRSDRE